jgi:hypothetical protein
LNAVLIFCMKVRLRNVAFVHVFLHNILHFAANYVC